MFQHVQAGTFFGLLVNDSIEFLSNLVQLSLNFLQARLPFLDGAAACLDSHFLGFDVRREFLQAGIEPRALLFELDFFRRKFFQAHNIALLLQIERVNFVTHACELLRGRKGVRLCAAHVVLLRDQLLLDRLHRITILLQCFAMLFEREVRRGELFSHHGEFFPGG